MKASEVRELTTKEIIERVAVEKEQLNKMKINHAVSPLDNPSQIKEMRKTVARLETELQQRKSNEVAK